MCDGTIAMAGVAGAAGGDVLRAAGPRTRAGTFPTDEVVMQSFAFII